MRRSPLKQVGERALRLRRWHEYSDQRTQARATRFGVIHCEGCGATHVPTDWAHLFGRGNIIAEPWCSTPQLTAQLCRTCHNGVDRGFDKELALRLRREALLRLAGHWGELHYVDWPSEDPIEAVRTCERWLKEHADRATLPDFAPDWR